MSNIYPLKAEKTRQEKQEKSFTFDIGREFTPYIEELCREYMPESSAKAVAWLNHCVVFGIYENGKVTWGEDRDLSGRQFIEIRIFNDNEELYIGKNKIRYIKDSPADSNAPEKETTEYVETRSRLWGKLDKKLSAKFIVLYDKERQIRMTVPFAGNSEYYELVLRSYIDYNDKEAATDKKVQKTGQAGYAYYRYADIKTKGDK